MASEQSGDTTVEVSIPVALSRWLDERARDWQVDRETLIRQLLTAYQVATTLERAEDGSVEFDEPFEEGSEELIRLLDSASHSLDTRFDRLERRYTDDLEDVRKRVIQLKRELDGKAKASHRHPDLAEDIDDLESTVRSVSDRLETLVDEIETIEGRFTKGFENYQGILEHLVDRADKLDDRLDKVATVLVRHRDDITAVSDLVDDHEQLTAISNEAIENGVRTAECDQCGITIDIGLLTRPTCPECEARFETVVPKSGFFGKSRLETVDPPALEPVDEFDGFEFGPASKIDELERERRTNEGEPTNGDDQ